MRKGRATVERSPRLEMPEEKKNQTFFLSQALPGALDAEALKT